MVNSRARRRALRLLRIRASALTVVLAASVAWGPTALAAGRAAAEPAWAQSGAAAKADEPAGAAVLPEGVVARVNGEPVTIDEFRDFFRIYLAQTYYHGVEPDKYPAIAEDAFEMLVTDRLLLQEAERRGLAGDAESVTKRLAQLRTRYARSPGGAEAFDRDAEQLAMELLRDTKIGALTALVKDVGELTEAEIRAFYEANPDLFTTPAATDVSMILIPVPPHGVSDEWRAAQEEAAALRERVLAGESFADLAVAHSKDRSAEQGGHLGLVHDGQFPDHVAAALTAVEIGAVAAPIRVLEGVAVFRVNGRQAARLQPLEAVRDRAEALMRRDLRERRWAEFLDELREQAQIERIPQLDGLIDAY